MVCLKSEKIRPYCGNDIISMGNIDNMDRVYDTWENENILQLAREMH